MFPLFRKIINEESNWLLCFVLYNAPPPISRQIVLLEEEFHGLFRRGSKGRKRSESTVRSGSAERFWHVQENEQNA